MPLLTATQARDRVSRGGKPLDPTEFNDAWVNDVIADFEALVLDYRGEIATTATVTETVRAVGVSGRLRWPLVTSITSVTVSGSALSASDYYLDAGMVMRSAGSFCKTSPATVVYVHGFASRAPLVKACALYVEKTAALERGGTTGDVRYEGEVTGFLTADLKAGRPTSWGKVNEYLNRLPDYREIGVG